MNTDTATDVYTANGYSSRADYLAQLCDEYPADVVHTLADLLGETEDFDGLVTMLEDHQVNDDEDDIYLDDAPRTVAATIAARDADRAGAHAQTVREAFDAAYISTPAREAAAVRTARENLTGAYLEADAALNAALDALKDARAVYAAASAALDAAD